MQSTILKGVDALPLSALITCGAVSGAFTSLILTPIELVKCKMQVPLETTGGQVVARPGLFTLIGTIYRHDGVKGFWRGQMGTLIRETGGSAAWFGSYEAVSAAFRKARAKLDTMPLQDASSKEDALPIYQQMCAGAIAGMSYNFLFYPADTIKSRMQTEDVAATQGSKKSFAGVGRALWAQHGLKGMYRGCGITVARAAPSSALIFSIYEGLRRTF